MTQSMLATATARAARAAFGPLNLLAFGAKPDGKTDNAETINFALKVSAAQGQPLLVPAGCGKFAYADCLYAEDGAQLIGEGDESILFSLDPDRSAIRLRGAGGVVRRLRLTGVTPTVRNSARECKRILGETCTGFLVADVLIDSGNGSAIHMTDECGDGRIINNRVSGTLADSIHLTDRAHHILVQGNVIRNSGDDGIACVSYADQGAMVNHVIARFNDIRNNRGGRGMTVVGGSDVLYECNYIADNHGAAGMLFAQEESYNTFAAHNVHARRNTIHNCGSVEIDHTAVMIASGDTEKNSDVHVERNVVHFDPGFENCGGIRARSEDVRVTIDRNVIANATPPTRINYPDLVALIEYEDGPAGVPGRLEQDDNEQANRGARGTEPQRP
jgi:hypothetical protein